MRLRITTALLALSVLAVAPAGATGAKPALKLVKKTPVTVQGAHFKSLERVTVTVTAAGIPTVKKVRATRVGSFTVAFGATIAPDRCSTFVVRAVGARGSLALFKLPQLMCLPARAG